MTIRVERLSVYADRGRSTAILDNVACSVEPRSLTLLIGQSGAGKTTLLRALAGLLEPDAGGISYDGEPLWRQRRVSRAIMLRYAAAFQFTEHQLFARTVQGEFDYSLRPYKLPSAERLRRVRTALAGQRLDERCLTEPPLAMSGGQKRRVALATVMAAETEWLLLDEPSAGLDAQSLDRFRQELTDWKSRCGIVLATHDLDAFLPMADRVLIMRGGTLAVDASPAELAADPALLTRHGIGLTGALELAAALRQADVPLPAAAALSPRQLAEAISGSLRADNGRRSEDALHSDEALHSSDEPASERGQQQPSTQQTPLSGRQQAPSAQHTPPPERAPTNTGRVYALDVKLKWLLYMLLSTGIVIQRTWEGAAASLIVVLLLAPLLVKDDFRKMVRLSKPLLLLILVAAVLSGVRLHLGQGLPWSEMFGFSLESAAETIRRLGILLEVTIVSLVFTLSTGTTAMKQGLEVLLRPLRRVGVRTEMLALAASLVLRFIPLILEEAERFAAIAKARGKRASRRNSIHARDLPAFVIPLMTALFQAVEELIVAIELKSYMDKATRPLPDLYVRKPDRRMAAAGALLFAGLVAVKIFV